MDFITNVTAAQASKMWRCVRGTNVKKIGEHNTLKEDEKEWKGERKSEKSTVGHHSQRHKSRHSQLDSNANPAPSTRCKGQP